MRPVRGLDIHPAGDKILEVNWGRSLKISEVYAGAPQTCVHMVVMNGGVCDPGRLVI